MIKNLFLIFLLSSCNLSFEIPVNQDPAIIQGQAVYMSNCITCHNVDPSLDGSIGPAISGSSEELLTHKLLTRDYPPGYKPKRSSNLMSDFPQLKNDIPAIQAYLNTFKK